MNLPTKGASKAEIIFRLQEVAEELQLTHRDGALPASQKSMAILTKFHILNNILKERFNADYISMDKNEQELLVAEYGLQLESETNNI